jgi:hypothetical protein
MRTLLFVASIAVLGLTWSVAADAGKTPASHAAKAPAFSVPFRDDDYAAALQAAQAKNVPVFVESWAPW